MRSAVMPWASSFKGEHHARRWRSNSLPCTTFTLWFLGLSVQLSPEGTHLSRKKPAFTEGHTDWLTVIQPPAYAPDLNPVEGAWSVMKNSLGNLAAGTTGQLAAAMRHQLNRIQRQHSLINGFLGQTGLTLDLQPP
jgi:hypothetical protein